jgi:nucleotide-binding universal stress UspA family protein
MYTTILVPLDGSPRAEAILPHAEELAGHYHAQIILLQVVELPSVNSFEGYNSEWHQKVMAKRADEATAYLEDVGQRLRTSGVSVSLRVESGTVVSRILQMAEETGADLIAMASHGRSGILRVFYGSVAAGILQRVDRPLLLIRSRQTRF